MGYVKGPKKPGKVLTNALRLGLSATLELARNRVTSETIHLLVKVETLDDEDTKSGMREIWTEALKEYRKTIKARKPSAEAFHKAEHSIRRNYYKLIWNSAVRYGNDEAKRKRRQEDKKYLNMLMDYMGARIRDLSMVRYPFPEMIKMPRKVGIREYGYRGNANTPEYFSAHSTPEMDFMDMIRSHLLELTRQCLKYNVPIKHARKSIDDLIDNLIPFLDYVYSERKIGKPNFTSEAIKELRKIVLKIRSQFGKQNGRPQSITSSAREKVKHDSEDNQSTKISNIELVEESIEPDPYLESFDDEPSEFQDDDKEEFEEMDYENLFEQLMQSCQTDLHPEWKKHIKTVRKLIKQNILTAKDAEHLVMQVNEESRRIGKAFHDFMANSDQSHRPFTLYAPIRYGDKIIFEDSGYLLVAEVSVAFGRGRVDLVLFRRKSLSRVDESIEEKSWEPCMVIDIKTKSAFNVDMYAVRTKSEDITKRVVEFDLERRKLTNEEWDRVINDIPTDYERFQLDAYSQTICSEYKRIVKRDVNPPKGVVKVVLVVDSKENWKDISNNLMRIIIDIFEETQKKKNDEKELFLCDVDGQLRRMGLVVFENKAETRDAIPPEYIERFDPFQYSRKRKDDRKFILYNSISGKGSPSESAARIAAMWHGLQYIHKLAKGKHREVIWLDLTGEYSDPKLRGHRLRLREQASSVVQFVRRKVKFFDMSSVIRKYTHGETTLRSITDFIRPILSKHKHPFIIVTGSNMVRKSTPKMQEGLLNEFLIQFIASVPSKSTVIWFDRPVPLTITNSRYDIRCVAPFYNDSPWMNYVDEVLYNIQMPPPRFGSHASADDDARVLVIEQSERVICKDGNNEQVGKITRVIDEHGHKRTINCELIEIDVLRNWGEKFRSEDTSEKDDETEVELTFIGPGDKQEKRGRGRPKRTYGEADIDTALRLLPHLSPPREKDDIVKISKSDIQNQTLAKLDRSLRLSFAPFQLKCEKKISNKGEKVRKILLEPLKHINSRRIYRTTRLYGTQPILSTRPPHKGLLEPNDFDLQSMMKSELSGMKRILRFLENKGNITDEWNEILDTLGTIISTTEKSETTEITHYALYISRRIRQLLEQHAQSKAIWDVLKKKRSWLPSGLSREQHDHLHKIFVNYPDIFLITGNSLFLLVLAATKTYCNPTLPTHLVEELWDYVQPWQLVQLGFTPKYHNDHRTGESILHRGRIYESLVNRTQALGALLEKMHDVSDVRFGQAIMIESGMTNRPSAIWLSCQSKPGHHEMEVILLSTEEDPARGVVEVLRRFVRDKPYWGESDITRLSQYAKIPPDSVRIPIMFAQQRGIRGLWVLNRTRKEWNPIGRVEYYPRTKETVTHIRSLTIRQDSSLQPIHLQDVRKYPRAISDQLDAALGIIRVAYSKCIQVRCKVSIDTEEKMFVLSFTKKQGSMDSDMGRLLVKRTANVLEIMRRPDMECEPVQVSGKKLVWNRYKDNIEYEGDAFLLKQWVERSDPYKYTSISLPPTAEQFVDAVRKSGLRIRVQHDSSACPLRNIPPNELGKIQKSSKGRVREYLKQVEGNEGEPEKLTNESIYSHGLCWRVSIDSEENLPESVRAIEELALKGATLRTFLETGSLVYEVGDGWCISDFDIPNPDKLPREFNESIHLMVIRRRGQVVKEKPKEPVFPGTYIIEEWIPDIRGHRDRIEFKIQSQVTEEIRTHMIFENSFQQMRPEKLRELLWTGMFELVGEPDLEANEHLFELVRAEIDKYVELAEDYEALTYQYKGLGKDYDGAGGEVKTADFERNDGTPLEVVVTQRLEQYQSWTILQGGISPEHIENDVKEKLSQYDIEDCVIEQVIEDVKGFLDGLKDVKVFKG